MKHSGCARHVWKQAFYSVTMAAAGTSEAEGSGVVSCSSVEGSARGDSLAGLVTLVGDTDSEWFTEGEVACGMLYGER